MQITRNQWICLLSLSVALCLCLSPALIAHPRVAPQESDEADDETNAANGPNDSDDEDRELYRGAETAESLSAAVGDDASYEQGTASVEDSTAAGDQHGLAAQQTEQTERAVHAEAAGVAADATQSEARDGTSIVETPHSLAAEPDSEPEPELEPEPEPAETEREVETATERRMAAEAEAATENETERGEAVAEPEPEPKPSTEKGEAGTEAEAEAAAESPAESAAVGQLFSGATADSVFLVDADGRLWFGYFSLRSSVACGSSLSLSLSLSSPLLSSCCEMRESRHIRRYSRTVHQRFR